MNRRRFLRLLGALPVAPAVVAAAVTLERKKTEGSFRDFPIVIDRSKLWKTYSTNYGPADKERRHVVILDEFATEQDLRYFGTYKGASLYAHPRLEI